MVYLILFLMAVFCTVILLLRHDKSQNNNAPSDYTTHSPLTPSSKFKPQIKPFLSAADRGKLGEDAFLLTTKLYLPGCYRIINNVTLQTDNGCTTQIDHIIISRFGVFVIETKSRSGWIFGTETQREWTQKLHKKTYKFQNPLRQNYLHIKTIESLISVPARTMHSVIVFFGDCELKTELPPNVTRRNEYADYIKSFGEVLYSDAEVEWMASTIEVARLPPSQFTNDLHVNNLKARFDTAKIKSCPRCGCSMVMRKAKRGLNKGNEFWGCSTYPKCKAIENIFTPDKKLKSIQECEE